MLWLEHFYLCPSPVSSFIYPLISNLVDLNPTSDDPISRSPLAFSERDNESNENSTFWNINKTIIWVNNTEL